MRQVGRTIVSEYQNSPTIDAIIGSMNLAIQPSTDLDAFYKNYWNIYTAVGAGLDFWGAILGVSRLLQVSNGPFFGFSGTGYQPFSQAPFYSVSGGTVTVALTDPAYRTLLLTKALSNITDCTIPNLNKLLTFLFAGRGIVYVADLGNMRIEYVFNFTLTLVEVAILNTSGAVPRPAGVSYTVSAPSS